MVVHVSLPEPVNVQQVGQDLGVSLVSTNLLTFIKLAILCDSGK